MASDDLIVFRLTPVQKSLIKKEFGKAPPILRVPPEPPIVLKYGVFPRPPPSDKVLMILTPKQRLHVKQKLKVECEYIELTEELISRQ